ncbi:hypothetical protein [Streptomyces sp. V3I7]|uniref:hypothetical protein n=1 Tax=Streptomyces sp. V3I7 TaxID=3042278 RepID=UPI0027821293|nr:hypothetical protein [Streptomyces sp. V3I7]MDQ0993725.1 hypothetical protein [Streptomyces sp. V3I7]
MGGRQASAARELLTRTLHGGLSEREMVAAAWTVVTELGAPERLSELIADLASGVGAPEGCALLSYRHILGFDKLLLLDGSPQFMLRAHVWHPGVGAVGKEDVHNHRSPLGSYIVRGRLVMELYEAVHEDGNSEDGNSGSGFAADQYVESLSDGDADWLLEHVGRARLRMTHLGRYAAGSSYALPAHTLHRAWCDTDEPTVTLFLEAGAQRRLRTDVFTAAGPHPDAVAKDPLDAEGYLAALNDLTELLRSSSPDS